MRDWHQQLGTEQGFLFILVIAMPPRLTTEEFLKRARSVHGDIYSYDKVKYELIHRKVTITCRIHGDFEQTPDNHLHGKGCKACGNIKIGRRLRASRVEFVTRANETHGNLYDYSKVRYINMRTKVSIICPEHGPFEQQPYSHLVGNGCPICGDLRTATLRKVSTEEFIERAQNVHGRFYDYSKVDVNGTDNLVTIVCPKHGEFEQIATNHLAGKGCSACNQSRGEERVVRFLDSMGVRYTRQKRFRACKLLRPLPFDFYFVLDDKEFLVEYDGIQHRIPKTIFGGKAGLKKRQRKDKIKDDFAKQHGHILIRISHTVEGVEAYLKYEIEKHLSSLLHPLPDLTNSNRPLNPDRYFQLRLM